jgi:hypothetical protein
MQPVEGHLAANALQLHAVTLRCSGQSVPQCAAKCRHGASSLRFSGPPAATFATMRTVASFGYLLPGNHASLLVFAKRFYPAPSAPGKT